MEIQLASDMITRSRLADLLQCLSFNFIPEGLSGCNELQELQKGGRIKTVGHCQ